MAALGLGSRAAAEKAPAPGAASGAPTAQAAALNVEMLPRKAALAAAISLEGADDVATRGEQLRLLRAAARDEAGGSVVAGEDDLQVRAEALWRLAATLAESERTAELIEGAEALAGSRRLGRLRRLRVSGQGMSDAARLRLEQQFESSGVNP